MTQPTDPRPGDGYERTYWRATIDGAVYPVYRLRTLDEPGACEVGDGCSGTEWIFGVAGDLSIVLCDGHSSEMEQITEAEYNRLADQMGAGE